MDEATLSTPIADIRGWVLRNSESRGLVRFHGQLSKVTSWVSVEDVTMGWR